MSKTSAGKDNASGKALRSAALGLAAAAAVFSLVVAGLLSWNRLGRKKPELLDTRELPALKEKLIEQPRDKVLKRRIRKLDLRLRREYFRRRNFYKRGAWLLLGGLLVFLSASRFVGARRRKEPTIPATRPDAWAEERAAATARWSVATVGGLLGAGAALTLLAAPAAPRYETATAGGSGSDIPAADRSDKRPKQTPLFYPPPEEVRRQWPRFRGPFGAGVATESEAAALRDWDGKTGRGVLWKTSVPLPGKSSPAVWGKHLFLTGATKDRREVFCFDTDTGKLLWRGAVEKNNEAAEEAPEVTEDTGYAAPTPVVDGKRVYAVFADGNLACFDFDGRKKWALSLGVPENVYGHAASLLRYGRLLLVPFDQGSDGEEGKSELLALDAATGETVWSVERKVPNSWSTPIIVFGKKADPPASAAGTGETTAATEKTTTATLLTCADPWLIAYDPRNGREIWRAEVLGGDVAPSPVAGGGLVFVAAQATKLSAIKPSGAGNVTKTQVVWSYEDNLPDICSPLYDGRRVYLLSTPGVLTCFVAATGRKLWEKDLETSFYASPVLVGDRIYLTARDGTTIIIRAADKYEEIHRSSLGEKVDAGPAFLRGRIYLRGLKHLFAVGKKEKAEAGKKAKEAGK